MKAIYIFTIFSIFFFTFSGLNSFAQTAIEEEYQMQQYFMVFLKKGPNRTQDSVTALKIQNGHLNNISRLFDEKKLILAGPFLDESEFLGIFILDVPTYGEAENLVLTDPAVKTGRLAFEIHPWYGPGNIVVQKKE